MDAVEVLRKSTLYRGALGDNFVDWLLGIKDFEIARFTEAEGTWDAENVSQWEHREYFSQYWATAGGTAVGRWCRHTAGWRY